MEQFITILIIIHASFGGIALLSGTLSVIAEKGNKLHRKSGLAFFYSMMFCGFSAFVIALLPGHESPFLIGVGIFSLYFVFTGYRALRLKRKLVNVTLDKAVAIFMFLSGIAMIGYHPLFLAKINLVLTPFGMIGILFSIQDLRLFRNPDKFKSFWLRQHLTRMLAGYIAAITAFVVVNQLLPGVVGWLLPGVVGAVIITFWNRKVKQKSKPIQVQK